MIEEMESEKSLEKRLFETKMTKTEGSPKSINPNLLWGIFGMIISLASLSAFTLLPVFPFAVPIILGIGFGGLLVGTTISHIADKNNELTQEKNLKKEPCLVYSFYKERIHEQETLLKKPEQAFLRIPDLQVLSSTQQVAYFKEHGFTLLDYLDITLRLSIDKLDRLPTDTPKELKEALTETQKSIEEKIDFLTNNLHKNYRLNEASIEEMVSRLSTPKLTQYTNYLKNRLPSQSKSALEDKKIASKQNAMNLTCSPLSHKKTQEQLPLL